MTGLLSLNPANDLAHYRAEYEQRGIVQIPNVLTDRAAQTLHSILTGNIPWRFLYTDDKDQPVHFTHEELQARGQEAYRRDMGDVLKRAQENRGFYYQTYPMIEGYLKEWDQGHPIHQATEFINSPEFLGLGREITGVGGITKADAHATAYGPGHFLTRHLDYGEDKERRAAYVLGMTEGWQPDWGGLLLFLNGKQDVTEGYLPRFNVLTIFDVKYLHTVTQVSSFAGKLRTSVTGWFRDDPTQRSA